MKHVRNFLRCSSAAIVGVYAISIPAMAEAPAATPVVVNEPAEIMVTARRRAENIQAVPVSVQVITGNTLQNLAITKPEDLSKLAAGLTLTSQANNGDSAVIILRGVRWSSGSGTEAIPVYLNDSSFEPSAILQTLYDIGQVEVLRGPQGTSRGAPSISGAITITTKAPDLTHVGGYVSGQAGSANHWIGQGAVNVPVIKEMLAVRIAGLAEDNEGNQVRSVNSSVAPIVKTRSWRASVLFKPTDTVTIDATYQLLSSFGHLYKQVVGTGSQGNASRGIPANFNGPAINADDYQSVAPIPSTIDSTYRHLTVHASWDVLGQQLNYNYGLEKQREAAQTINDPGNMVPGFDALSQLTIRPGNYYNVHELRLSSLRSPGRVFDYDIGFYRNRSDAVQDVTFPTFLAGAFGRPTVALPGQVTAPVSRYVLPVAYAIPLSVRNQSFYGNVQLHLPGAIELSGGIRAISDQRPAGITITTGSAFNAVTNPLIPAAAYCPYLPGFPAGTVASPVYTGAPATCDVPVAASSSTLNLAKTYKPVIWNASLSHKFTPEVLAYATVGTSWRQGLPALSDPTVPTNLLFPKPETATSYEVGVKSAIGRMVHLNVDVFQIDYKNQLTTLSGVQYFDPTGGRIKTASVAFYGNVDAQVRGIEAELQVRPSRAVSFGANLSYARIASRGGSVPCNNAAIALDAANPINTCNSPSGQTLNVSAPLSATANGTYTVPVGPVDGYVRFNVDFQGENPNFGNATSTPAYALVDLFAGINGHDRNWSVGIYAKNAFNKRQVLTTQPLVNAFYPDFGATAYNSITMNLPRELGVNLRYAFGAQ